MITNKNLDGFPYNRIYFSFLKGIPNFMYNQVNIGEWKYGFYYALKIVLKITFLQENKNKDNKPQIEVHYK